MLTRVILVHDIRRRVQDRTCSQQGHRATENKTKAKAKNEAAKDEPQTDKKTDFEKPSHEREIFLRDENR